MDVRFDLKVGPSAHSTLNYGKGDDGNGKRKLSNVSSGTGSYLAYDPKERQWRVKEGQMPNLGRGDDDSILPLTEAGTGKPGKRQRKRAREAIDDLKEKEAKWIEVRENWIAAVNSALDKGKVIPTCPPLPGRVEEAQLTEGKPLPKVRGRETWADVAKACKVIEVRPKIIDGKLDQDDGEHVRKMIGKAIIAHSKSDERDNRPKIKRLVVTNYGTIKIACEDNYTHGWVQKTIPELPKRSTWTYDLACYDEDERPYVPYTLRIKDPDWITNHRELIDILQYMNEGLEHGEIGFGGVIKDYDKEKGGAVIRLLFEAKLLPVLQQLEFAPRLQIGHVTLWGQGHKWNDRHGYEEEEEEEEMVVVDTRMSNNGRMTREEEELACKEAAEMLNDTELDAEEQQLNAEQEDNVDLM